jgi:hypothetical protein
LPLAVAACRQLLVHPDLTLATVTDYPIPALRLDSKDTDALARAVITCTTLLGRPYNLLIPSATRVFIAGRSNEEGFPGKRFGALEVAGLFVALRDPHVPDYDSFVEALVHVGLSPDMQMSWEQRVVEALEGSHGVISDAVGETRLVIGVL